jgi:4-hydroxy-tetrahydrodipicolinate reductase
MIMKIALIGYGKMGKAIEEVALQRGHEIVAKIDQNNYEKLADSLKIADVAIEFTRPDAAVTNIRACLAANTPVVVGTTGWNTELETLTQETKLQKGSLLHASNFSVGINLFFALNAQLAKLMSIHNSYSASISETHHIHKLDEPSGTAISLADQVIQNHDGYQSWELNAHQEGILPIHAFREGEVPGTHEVNYASEIDTISIKHEAHNRKGFATGAVLAAEWLPGKEGVFTMIDVLGL